MMLEVFWLKAFEWFSSNIAGTVISVVWAYGLPDVIVPVSIYDDYRKFWLLIPVLLAYSLCITVTFPYLSLLVTDYLKKTRGSKLISSEPEDVEGDAEENQHASETVAHISSLFVNAFNTCLTVADCLLLSATIDVLTGSKRSDNDGGGITPSVIHNSYKPAGGFTHGPGSPDHYFHPHPHSLERRYHAREHHRLMLSRPSIWPPPGQPLQFPTMPTTPTPEAPVSADRQYVGHIKALLLVLAVALMWTYFSASVLRKTTQKLQGGAHLSRYARFFYSSLRGRFFSSVGYLWNIVFTIAFFAPIEFQSSCDTRLMLLYFARSFVFAAVGVPLVLWYFEPVEVACDWPDTWRKLRHETVVHVVTFGVSGAFNNLFAIWLASLIPYGASLACAYAFAVASTGLIFVCARLWSWEPKGCLHTQIFRLATLTSLYFFWNPWYSTVIYIFDVFDTHSRPNLSKCLFSVALTTVTLSFVNWRLLHYLARAKKKRQRGYTDLEETLVPETPDFNLAEMNPS